MSQSERAAEFAALHVPGKPLVLYNMWDAGSAIALAKAGAPAVATGSWSVAGSLGYADGQALPLASLLAVVERITDSVSIPVSVDFEGAYAEAPDAAAENVGSIHAAGAVGINFEDQVVGGEGLHDIGAQVARIRAIRDGAVHSAFFINARTDIYLKAAKDADQDALLAEATARCQAYADAGASGFFAPGLRSLSHIASLCKASPIPVNVMMLGDMPSVAELADVGVARISHGPGPWRAAMAQLAKGYEEATASS